MQFSERLGFKQPKGIIQIDSMDDELRNSLWNALSIFYCASLILDERELAGSEKCIFLYDEHSPTAVCKWSTLYRAVWA